jgi:hypothetical protein
MSATLMYPAIGAIALNNDDAAMTMNPPFDHPTA